MRKRTQWWNIFSSLKADLCEKKIPLLRKRWGFCPETFSILSTSSLSTLLLPNLTKERPDTTQMSMLCSLNYLIVQSTLWRKQNDCNCCKKTWSSLLKAISEVNLNLTYEFFIIHSLGVVRGNVPRVDCVFLISATCCWPVVGGNRVLWRWTACFVVLTCHLFVVCFQLYQQLDSSINISLQGAKHHRQMTHSHTEKSNQIPTDSSGTVVLSGCASQKTKVIR